MKQAIERAVEQILKDCGYKTIRLIEVEGDLDEIFQGVIDTKVKLTIRVAKR